jgi:lysophospholipase L1-like esterase
MLGMNPRVQNAGLIALLVLAMVVVGLALRPKPVPAQGSASPSVSARSSTSPSAPTSSGSPSPAASGPTIAFLGDSFTAGKGAVPQTARWTSLVAKELNAKEVNFGEPGTGYLRAGRANACEGKPCAAFEGLVAKVVAAKPDIVMIAGGANDVGLPLDEVRAAVVKTITSLHKGLPEAEINVVTPWWDSRPETAAFTDLVAAVKEAAKANGALYVDTGQPFAGHPELLGNGEATNKGHRALADAVLKAGRALNASAPTASPSAS